MSNRRNKTRRATEWFPSSTEQAARIAAVEVAVAEVVAALDLTAAVDLDHIAAPALAVPDLAGRAAARPAVTERCRIAADRLARAAADRRQAARSRSLLALAQTQERCCKTIRCNSAATMLRCRTATTRDCCRNCPVAAQRRAHKDRRSRQHKPQSARAWERRRSWLRYSNCLQRTRWRTPRSNRGSRQLTVWTVRAGYSGLIAIAIV